jgi:O-antigen/teichoic acid export membrane protein
VQVLKNGFYNLAAGVVRMGLSLLTMPLLIRFLGLEVYGLWSLVSAVVGLIALAEAGLSTATTVFVSQDLGRDDRDSLAQTLTVTMTAMLGVATLAAIGLWLGAETIVTWFPKLLPSHQLAAVQSLQIAGLVVWARLLQQVLVGVEQAYQCYKQLNLIHTLQWSMMNMGWLIVAWRNGDIVNLMQWQALTCGLTLLGHVGLVRSLVHSANLRWGWHRQKGLAVCRYSGMTWLTSLGGALFARGDRLIVGGLLGAQVLGVYAAITDVASTINGLSAMPVQPLLPTLSHTMAESSVRGGTLQQRVKQALEINGFVALGLGAALFMLAPLVMPLIVTGKATHPESILAFRLAAMIYALYSVNAVGYYVLFSVNGLQQSMITQLLSGILALLLIAIGSHFWGLTGAILGNSGYLGVWFLTIIGMNRLKIVWQTWAEWLIFPLLWFFSVTAIGFLLSDHLNLIIGATLIQTAILIHWLLRAQPQLIPAFRHHFNFTRS